MWLANLIFTPIRPLGHRSDHYWRGYVAGLKADANGARTEHAEDYRRDYWHRYLLYIRSYVLVRASPISRILDWSYIKGGLIAQFRHINATNPYFVRVSDLFCIALTVFNHRNLNGKKT
jgi:hypothetical protein